MNKQNKGYHLEKVQKELQFSGSFYARKGNEILQGSNGFRNYAEKINNQLNTRFSIASGSKLFTSIAICKLVETGEISFTSRLKDCLDIDFPHVNDQVTIHHLLTHTSGVPDYFDEDTMDDYEALWHSRPMYRIRSPKDFLPLFQHEPMQATVNSSFQYNNSGYILLGLIVEQIATCSFSTYIEEQIFHKAGMKKSGYFELNRLPENTALGYIEEPVGTWKTNIYSLPAKGGPDGGAYVTAEDMVLCWQALTDYQLLSKEMTQLFLKPREVVSAEQNIYYGYCGYMELDDQNEIVKYIQMGYDPGVNFRAVHYPTTKASVVVCSNTSEGAYELLKEIENMLT
ncbi:serine hydrolase [Virgibacillus sp. Bac330]|uniref:serine hydrolase domain-containing protein n=1 Tax=Virgibacillus sp. Bac330 TaxID=2419841 RepID=UPI000EF48FA5|nr:serine hydrolase [Virgibacillus sp. Bac330]